MSYNPVIVDWRPWVHGESRTGRQFIFIEGSKFHSGGTWARQGWGVARSGSGLFGYHNEDLIQLAKEIDMDFPSISVTHWAPAMVAWPNEKAGKTIC